MKLVDIKSSQKYQVRKRKLELWGVKAKMNKTKLATMTRQIPKQKLERFIWENYISHTHPEDIKKRIRDKNTTLKRVNRLLDTWEKSIPYFEEYFKEYRKCLKDGSEFIPPKSIGPGEVYKKLQDTEYAHLSKQYIYKLYKEWVEDGIMIKKDGSYHARWGKPKHIKRTVASRRRSRMRYPDNLVKAQRDIQDFKFLKYADSRPVMEILKDLKSEMFRRVAGKRIVDLYMESLQRRI